MTSRRHPRSSLRWVLAAAFGLCVVAVPHGAFAAQRTTAQRPAATHTDRTAALAGRHLAARHLATGHLAARHLAGSDAVGGVHLRRAPGHLGAAPLALLALTVLVGGLAVVRRRTSPATAAVGAATARGPPAHPAIRSRHS